MSASDATEVFVAHRNLLFTVAYEMLGSAADAEDVLQETWLRWAAEMVDLGEVREPRAYLVRITTRLALNRIRTLARRRESYVGPWLPEPLLTAPDVAEDVELADSVSTAMLLVLETLTPTERAVFVLREVFDLPYDEIAAAVDKSAPAVRQIAHRARSHVEARRPRQQVRRDEQTAVVERFLAAVSTGDLQGLLDVLSPDVVLITDGGGRKQAALRPIRGVEKVLRFLAAVMPDDGSASAAPVVGQRRPGSAPAARRRARHRRHHAGRQRRRHRALPRPQPRQAGAGRGGGRALQIGWQHKTGERPGLTSMALRVRRSRRPSEPAPVSTGEGSHRAAHPSAARPARAHLLLPRGHRRQRPRGSSTARPTRSCSSRTSRS